MISCDLGVIKEGLLAVRLPALNIREIRLVFVRSAAYTTVKQNPAPNLRHQKHAENSFVKAKKLYNNTILHILQPH